jgi:hypothetical protein
LTWQTGILKVTTIPVTSVRTWSLFATQVT